MKLHTLSLILLLCTSTYLNAMQQTIAQVQHPTLPQLNKKQLESMVELIAVEKNHLQAWFNLEDAKQKKFQPKDEEQYLEIAQKKLYTVYKTLDDAVHNEIRRIYELEGKSASMYAQKNTNKVQTFPSSTGLALEIPNFQLLYIHYLRERMQAYSILYKERLATLYKAQLAAPKTSK